MWEIYDELLASIPADATVKSVLAGLSWFLVRSEGVGVSMRPPDGNGAVPGAGKLAGMKVRDLAVQVKSWNMYEAALGLAAINSVLNAPEAVERNCGPLLDKSESVDVFSYLLDDLRGKRVAVIGHFFGLEKVAAVCELSILERRPQPGDWPDPACEYLLPEQDVVIMTATTLINKTMPRLLDLSRGARIVVAGPTTPLTPILLDRGIDLLGGLIVEEPERAWTTVAEGGQKELFDAGARMVKVSRTPSGHSA